MWRELIERLDAQAVFHPPAAAEQLREAEATLGVALPAELRSLLLETNGVEVVYGLELVWSAEALAQRNRNMRSEWRRGEGASTAALGPLLFFGERGDGDLYYLPIAEQQILEDESTVEIVGLLSRSSYEALSSGSSAKRATFHPYPVALFSMRTFCSAIERGS